MITIENLTKSYGSKMVLKGISMSLDKGKTYGIIGKNGAGKTTLFRCIAGLESYNGSVVPDFNTATHQLGFLETEPFFFSKITGREYIRLLANARQIQLDGIDYKNVFDLPLDVYVSTYSTGMKKKLALLAILLQNNDTFILDEPFNGVDIQGNILITEILKELKLLEKTILISSHVFSTLLSICDVIVLFEKGHIAKIVHKDEFVHLENELKYFTIGNKIETLGLK